jgi:hypothetical protein
MKNRMKNGTTASPKGIHNHKTQHVVFELWLLKQFPSCVGQDSKQVLFSDHPKMHKHLYIHLLRKEKGIFDFLLRIATTLCIKLLQ